MRANYEDTLRSELAPLRIGGSRGAEHGGRGRFQRVLFDHAVCRVGDGHALVGPIVERREVQARAGDGVDPDRVGEQSGIAFDKNARRTPRA